MENVADRSFDLPLESTRDRWRSTFFVRFSRASRPVDIRHLQTHRAQPFPHRAGKTLHQFVTEIVIGLALVSQAARVDPKDADEV